MLSAHDNELGSWGCKLMGDWGRNKKANISTYTEPCSVQDPHGCLVWPARKYSLKAAHLVHPASERVVGFTFQDFRSILLQHRTHLPLGVSASGWGKWVPSAFLACPPWPLCPLVSCLPHALVLTSPLTWTAQSFSFFFILIRSNKRLKLPVDSVQNAFFLRWLLPIFDLKDHEILLFKLSTLLIRGHVTFPQGRIYLACFLMQMLLTGWCHLQSLAVNFHRGDR